MLVSLQQLTDLLHDREAEVPRDLYETVERTLEQLQEDIRSVDADQERAVKCLKDWQKTPSHFRQATLPGSAQRARCGDRPTGSAVGSVGG